MTTQPIPISKKLTNPVERVHLRSVSPSFLKKLEMIQIPRRVFVCGCKEFVDVKGCCDVYMNSEDFHTHHEGLVWKKDGKKCKRSIDGSNK